MSIRSEADKLVQNFFAGKFDIDGMRNDEKVLLLMALSLVETPIADKFFRLVNPYFINNPNSDHLVNFLNELKNREVYGAELSYIVSAWAFLHYNNEISERIFAKKVSEDLPIQLNVLLNILSDDELYNLAHAAFESDDPYGVYDNGKYLAVRRGE